MKWCEEYCDRHEGNGICAPYKRSWDGPDAPYFHADHPARTPAWFCEFYEGCMKYSDGWLEHSMGEWNAKLTIQQVKRRYKVLLNEIQFTTPDYIEFIAMKKTLEDEMDFELNEVRRHVKNPWDMMWDWPYNYPKQFDDSRVPSPYFLAQTGPTQTQQIGRDTVIVPRRSYDI